VLYIGSGSYPTVALYALARHSGLLIDGIDIVPHCTVLCERVAARLGLDHRLRAFTLDAATLDPATIERYDGFFISSAVRPKNAIIERLLEHKRSGALTYAREDEAHPHFYEPITVEHPEVLTARRARACWAAETGTRIPLPPGCETGQAKT
jgi:hypothetical protein